MPPFQRARTVHVRRAGVESEGRRAQRLRGVVLPIARSHGGNAREVREPGRVVADAPESVHHGGRVGHHGDWAHAVLAPVGVHDGPVGRRVEDAGLPRIF